MHAPIKNVKTINLNRRELAASFRQQPLTNLQKSNANTENITNSPKNVQNSNILLPEGASPFPTVTLEICTDFPTLCHAESW